MNGRTIQEHDQEHHDVSMMEINLATGDNRTETKWRNRTMPFAKLVAKLSRPTVTPETSQAYHAMPKTKQDTIKDVGGYVGGLLHGGRRKKESVAHRSLITLDLDHAGEMSVDDILARAEEVWPWAWVAHATHKHRTTAPRLRFVMPMSRTAIPDQYEAVSRALAGMMGIDLFDDSTYEHHRLMYWPSVPCDVEYVFKDRTAGLPAVDVDEILAEYGPDSAWKDTTLWPVSDRQSIIIRGDIKKKGDPRQNKGFVGAFNRVYTVPEAIESFLPGTYKKESSNATTEGRWTYVDGSSSNGLVIYDDGLFAYSHHSTDPASNHLCSAYDLVRLHKFGGLDADAKPETPINRLPSSLAMNEFVRGLDPVRVEIAREQIDSFPDLEAEEAAKQDLDWMAQLQMTDKGAIKPNFFNTVTVLRYDHAWRDKIYFNQFKEFVEITKGGRDWSEKDTLELWEDISRRYSVEWTENNIHKAIAQQGFQHEHHPIKEYLNALVWDGTPRVDTFWIDYLAEEDNPYTREAARIFLTGAVARIYHPGTKMDFVPVLYGKQGVRKTSLCRALAVKDEWFGELNSVDPKQAMEAILGKWIIELGEMDVSNRHEINTIKQFISGTETKVRLAYRRDSQIYKRQCVFIGTTNQHEYLRDSTGNRRWWPIDYPDELADNGIDINLEKLKRNIDQIWAEAVHIYLHDLNLQLYLTDEAKEIAEQRQEDKMPMEEWYGVITEWLKIPVTDDRYDRERHSNYFTNLDENTGQERDRVCIQEIWQDCLMMKGPIKRLQATRIAKIMDQNKQYTRHKSLLFGSRFGKQRGWTKLHFTPNR